MEVTGIRHEYLVGDETRINQILINLLSNAVKYTPEGGKIWCRILGLKQRSSQFEHICIEVEDNGYGMTPEFLATIFDAFSRAENSTTNKVQGTGLGWSCGYLRRRRTGASGRSGAFSGFWPWAEARRAGKICWPLWRIPG